MYNSNLAVVGGAGGANGYGYEHGSAYGGSAAKDLEEQVNSNLILLVLR